MTVEDRARRAGAALRERLSSVEPPEPQEIIHRAARRRRRTFIVVALPVVFAVLVPLVVTRLTETTRVIVSQPRPLIPPAGTETERAWTLVPKATSGLGTGSSIYALASSSGTAIAGGAVPKGARTSRVSASSAAR